MARTRRQWDALIAASPFPEHADDPRRLHALILAAVPAPEAVAALAALPCGRDRWELRDDVLYLRTPDGIGRSRLAPRIEPTLGVGATARNWRTVVALAELAEVAERES
jgi:uncharacterized protein (DUF1697 family)